MENPQQPPGPKRLPSLKITSRTTPAGGAAMITPNSSFQQATSPTPLTPSQGPSKIRLVTKSQPSTPAESRPPSLTRPGGASAANGLGTISAVPKITTKTGRISKPSAKKRTREESDDDDEEPLSKGTALAHQSKKTKITLKPTTPGLVRQPTLKVKPVGRIPTKPLGEGYDSEAEDREVDPVIEEQFLFRMMPGEPSDYLRTAIQNKQIGIPKSQGGADFQVKWLDEEGRRAAVTVMGQLYAAILLDLPSITEGMKTWDKKSMVKSSDICQMLMAFARVQSEEEAKTAPLPKAVEHGHRWPHGITPPMHDARNRRFRKRLSKLEIKNKEAEVDRLLASDREALSVRTEWIDNSKDGAEDDEEEEEYEEDAEGEADDYFGDGTMGQQLDEEEEFEVDDAALEAEFLEAVETPLVETPGLIADAATPNTAAAPTPAPQAEDEAGDAEEEESDEEDEEDGDEDEDEDDGDEDEAAAATRNVIANLKKQLKMYETQLAASVQPIMRKRLEGNIKNVKAEILLKKSSIGEVDED